MPPKPRTAPLTKIDVSLFTPLMETHLSIALERYFYLMSEFPSFKKRSYSPNEDFEFEYFDYYALKAARGDFSNPIVKEIYFDLVAHPTTLTNPDDLAIEFATRCTRRGVTIGHHLSFCSKAIHTNDLLMPIYDSRIQEYLTKIYSVGSTYSDIYDWYYTKNPSIISDQKAILTWFRTKFSRFAAVSDIKVLDTVIFIWHKYK